MIKINVGRRGNAKNLRITNDEVLEHSLLSYVCKIDQSSKPLTGKQLYIQLMRSDNVNEERRQAIVREIVAELERDLVKLWDTVTPVTASAESLHETLLEHVTDGCSIVIPFSHASVIMNEHFAPSVKFSDPCNTILLGYYMQESKNIPIYSTMVETGHMFFIDTNTTIFTYPLNLITLETYGDTVSFHAHFSLSAFKNTIKKISLTSD